MCGVQPRLLSTMPRRSPRLCAVLKECGVALASPAGDEELGYYYKAVW